MKPSALRPVMASAFGPYAAIHTGRSHPDSIQGIFTGVPR